MRKFFVVVSLLCALGQVRAQWVKTALKGVKVNTFLVDGTTLYAGTSGGVAISSDTGATWFVIKNGIADTNIVCLAQCNGLIFAGSDTAGIYLTINGGSTWSLTNFPHKPLYALLSSGTFLVAGTYGYLSTKVYASTDNGSTWTPSVGPPTVATVSALAMIGSKILAGTESGLWYSRDTSKSWTSTNMGSASVNAIVTAGTKTFAGAFPWPASGSPGGMYLSADSGSTWTRINNGLKDTNVTSLAVSGTSLYAGTPSGVFLTTNNGSNWILFNTGLKDTSVHALSVLGSYVFAGTDSGAWRRPVSQVTNVALNHVLVPSKLDLSQNYPNPFNPTTSIEFTVPGDGWTTLKIFDVLGQEVATLIEGELQGGTVHRVTFDATKLASGVYFSRLEFGGRQISKKLVLVK